MEGVVAVTDVSLPMFRYHPDPVGNGVISKSSATCRCCQKARGWIYNGPVFAVGELEASLCPWCIADGSAAQKLDASFADDQPLFDDGVASSVIEDVTRRTPGFNSWQQDRWLSHCGEACA